jgi:Fe-S-cluster-containing hydrogenase component 2
MATMITEACFNCGVCERMCPSDGISKGSETFVIDPELCTECVGFNHTQQCARVCPIEACVIDPNNAETEAVLFERAVKIHSDDTLELGPETSHFQAQDRTLGTSLKRMGRRIRDGVRGPSPAP